VRWLILKNKSVEEITFDEWRRFRPGVTKGYILGVRVPVRFVKWLGRRFSK
jgi:hypothetical protein